MINKIGKFLGMRTSTKSEVIIYHDQTKGFANTNFRGHVFLFVPYKLTFTEKTPLFGIREKRIFSKQLLFEEISKVRTKCNAIHKFHFTDISGKFGQKTI
ncbi:MAG: hypothetical protein WBB67_06310 [bacterium]